jgi:RsiW-degrading membrane proteinase PrsW (M82 family)
VRVRTVVASEIALLVGLAAAVAGAWLVEHGFGIDEPLALGPLATALVAAAPALLWLGYFATVDRAERVPRRHVVATFLAGAFLAGPLAAWALDAAVVIHAAAPPELDPLAPSRIVRAVLLVALAQEVAKYVVVRFGVYRSSELDHPLDAVIYATAAALGFAAHQTFRELEAGGGEVLASIAAMRTVSTALAHACCAVIVGYGLGVAKFRPAGAIARGLRLSAWLGGAALLNGQYLLTAGVLAAEDLVLTPWRVVAYGFGLAAVVFLAASILVRRLVTLAPLPSRLA